jgi:PqqD family protein of HPr-rel-A system
MAGPRYIADPADELKAVPLDGLVAIFHRPSGITHLLAPPAPQILEALAGRAAAADLLLARIGERFEVEGGAEALAARLAELEAAGLVRRA